MLKYAVKNLPSRHHSPGILDTHFRSFCIKFFVCYKQVLKNNKKNTSKQYLESLIKNVSSTVILREKVILSKPLHFCLTAYRSVHIHAEKNKYALFLYKRVLFSCLKCHFPPLSSTKKGE